MSVFVPLHPIGALLRLRFASVSVSLYVSVHVSIFVSVYPIGANLYTGALERRTSAPLTHVSELAPGHQAARVSPLSRSASTASSTAYSAGASAQHAQHAQHSAAQHGAGGSSGGGSNVGSRRSPVGKRAPSRSRSMSPRGTTPPGRSRLGRTTDESRATVDCVEDGGSGDYLGSSGGGGRRQLLSDSQTARSPTRSELSGSGELLCMTLTSSHSLMMKCKR